MSNDRKNKPSVSITPKTPHAPPGAHEDASEGRTGTEDVERQKRTSEAELAFDKALVRVPPG